MDEVKPVWEKIEALTAQIHGWTPIDQLFALFTITMASAGLEGDVLEVGSWSGRSAVVFGEAVKLLGHSVVHCVDLFPEKSDWRENPDGTYSFAVEIHGQKYQGYQEQTVWRDTFQNQVVKVYETSESLWEIFHRTIEARGMQGVVLAHRGDLESFLAARGTGFRCRVAFLDGDHGYQAVRQDIQSVEKHLVPGGWLCFDDAFTSYPGVDQAIREMILENPGYDLCRQMTRKLFVARRKPDVTGG
ncbi:MAG: class I SAM-dependent methyltransferase [Candidatus Riflebacteria bacterium]|nr:class I SAM-dependent methyltransferase [Candidatus Riflebacteria bacterium]